MQKYIDARVLAEPEFASHQLMDALFGKLHRALATLHSTRIGVSFPEVNEERPTLGDVLRVHGSEDELDRLMSLPWLTGMRDHVEVTERADVPASAGHQLVRRVQTKSSAERIRRRQMRRHQLSEGEARARVPDDVVRYVTLPFVNLASGSTGGHRFHLYFRHTEVAEAREGAFNSYGLSTHASVPRF